MIAGTEPVVADHRQQHVALVDRIADALAKIEAHGNGVDVEDDAAIAEVALEAVVHPPGDIGTVVTPV